MGWRRDMANRLTSRFESTSFVVYDSKRTRVTSSPSGLLRPYLRNSLPFADAGASCVSGAAFSMKFFRAFFGFLFFALIAGSVSFAQIAAGLRGRVLDPSGAAVANAHVELIESAKNVHQATTASSTGDYVFTNLNPGPYEVFVGASGFHSLHHTGITVAVGQTVTAALALSVGGDQRTVTVDSDYSVM